MKVRTLGLLAIAFVGLGTALVYAQNSGAKSKDSSLTAGLRSWAGQQCTVYLRMESDPRAGRASYSGSTGDGFTETEGTPISITGVISFVEDQAIVVTNGPRTSWIPRDQVRVISAYRP